jgi:hypothetical protein
MTRTGLVHTQHVRYLDDQGRGNETPQQAFKRDLLHALQNWRQAGERTALFMDANEDTMRGNFVCDLSSGTLQMHEAVCSKHLNLPVTPTFKVGSRIGSIPIDAAFLTPNLPIEAGTWLAFQQGPGDHRFCILEIKWSALIGENQFKISR